MVDEKIEDKTPKPEKPGGGQDANDMGGPAFHPDMDPKNKAPDEIVPKGGQEGYVAEILNDEQIPAVTPPDDE